MPLNESVYNATFERHEVMIYSRMFAFEPREFASIPEQYIPVIESEHYDKGLIVIRHGDDLKAKERQALLAYRELLIRRIKGYQAWMDMERGRGSTVEEPPKMIQAKKWLEQIETKLKMEAPIEEEKSFLVNEDLKLEAQRMFSGVPQVQEFKRKPGRPKSTSFEEADLSKEVEA